MDDELELREPPWARPSRRSKRRSTTPPSRNGGPELVYGRVRRVIFAIPRGKVITYGEVASAAGFPRGARLAVRVLRAGEGLPWHRVVAAGGRIALPGEDGREQRRRLEIEGVTFQGGRVRMDLYGWRPRRRPPR